MNIIVAVDKNWGIGKEGKLLCHIPGDLKFFKEKTMGHTVVMGRKTLMTLPGGGPLKGRRNIILTRNKNLHVEDAEVANSPEELLQMVDKDEEVFVIGGAEVYREMLKYCDTLYITKIHEEFEADAHFPNIDEDEDWELRERTQTYRENDVSYSFTLYRRKDER